MLGCQGNNYWIWIILAFFLLGSGGCGGTGNIFGSGCGNNWWWIIIIAVVLFWGNTGAACC